MKKCITFIILLISCLQIVLADEIYTNPAANTATSFQNIPYENCTKIYSISKENLFYLAIAAVNTSKFNIEEIQTQNGYIVFSTGKNKYLITVAGVDDSNSIIKITPCNNLYYFQPVILDSIYKYIDLNKDISE